MKIKTDVLETIPFTEEIVETDELAPGERKVEQTAYTGYKVKTYRNDIHFIQKGASEGVKELMEILKDITIS